MSAVLRGILRLHSRPLTPISSGVRPILRTMENLGAVLFDIYGTLLISANGETHSAEEGDSGHLFLEAARAAGLDPRCGGEEGLGAFRRAIRRSHERSHDRGIPYPEVDISEVWADTLASLGWERVDLAARLAVEFEARVNPTWLMPGALECLEGLCSRGVLLGIVSNAQFYTRELFPVHFSQPLSRLGFEEDLTFFSYEHGHAKPGSFLHERAREALARRGITAQEALHVGNDMLNDVLPARQTGFRTGLFAGDARSYRPRTGDARVADVVPDVVLTHLMQLTQCLTKT